MANSRNLAVNAAILLAASATASVAAPPNVAAVPQSPWLFGALLVLAFIAGACGWLLWDTRRRLRLAVQQPPLPPQDALSAAIVRDSSDAIFTIDAAGLVQSMNPAAAKQFGYSLEEIRGKNISTLIPPPARGRQRANYMTNPGMRELFGVRRDGSRFPVDVKLDELTFANWNLMGLSVRDISTRHASEKDLEQRLASAEAIVNQTGRGD